MMTAKKRWFSSATVECPTPQDFFDRLDSEFGFTLDSAASDENAKCPHYYTKKDDGLNQLWAGVVWCNPPYGRGLEKWVLKGYLAAQAGAIVVMLLPPRVDTHWWHDCVMKASEIRFVQGRLKFTNLGGSPRFSNVVIVFSPGCQGPPAVSSMRARLP